MMDLTSNELNFVLSKNKSNRILVMLVRKLRLKKGWSQEQLAELTSLSVRTIQRIERGQKPGLESAKSLASVFEVDHSQFLIGDYIMKTEHLLEQDEKEAMEYVKGIKEFYSHAFMYCVFAIAFLIFRDPTEPMVMWGLIGWGTGLILHGLVAFEKFNFISVNWEKKLIEKKLGRKL
jgi:XRE family transcriptional regulator, regulator of sulfur utilization